MTWSTGECDKGGLNVQVPVLPSGLSSQFLTALLSVRLRNGWVLLSQAIIPAIGSPLLSDCNCYRVGGYGRLSSMTRRRRDTNRVLARPREVEETTDTFLLSQCLARVQHIRTGMPEDKFRVLLLFLGDGIPLAIANLEDEIGVNSGVRVEVCAEVDIVIGKVLDLQCDTDGIPALIEVFFCSDCECERGIATRWLWPKRDCAEQNQRKQCALHREIFRIAHDCADCNATYLTVEAMEHSQARW